MSAEIEQISCDAVSRPAGHYSIATGWGDLLFVSGQLPIRPDGAHIVGEPFELQARQVLSNLFAVLAAARSAPQQVLRVTAYIVGVANWAEFDAIFGENFGDAKPARVVVPVPQLHHGYLVEVEAIAVRQT